MRAPWYHIKEGHSSADVETSLLASLHPLPATPATHADTYDCKPVPVQRHLQTRGAPGALQRPPCQCSQISPGGPKGQSSVGQRPACSLR